MENISKSVGNSDILKAHRITYLTNKLFINKILIEENYILMDEIRMFCSQV